MCRDLRSAHARRRPATPSPPTCRRPARTPAAPSAAANGPARPPGWRRATCRAISPSCRTRSPPTSCGSASSTRSPARCWRRARPAIRACRRSASDLDIRTDLCRYKVFRNGELIDEPTDIDQALARRSGDLRARLLVFVRGCADAGRHRAAPHHQRLDGADVSHLDPDRRRRGRSTDRWWFRCGR